VFQVVTGQSSKKKIRKVHSIDNDSAAIVVSYKDEDGDQITLDTNEEFIDLVEQYALNKRAIKLEAKVLSDSPSLEARSATFIVQPHSIQTQEGNPKPCEQKQSEASNIEPNTKTLVPVVPAVYFRNLSPRESVPAEHTKRTGVHHKNKYQKEQPQFFCKGEVTSSNPLERYLSSVQKINEEFNSLMMAHPEFVIKLQGLRNKVEEASEKYSRTNRNSSSFPRQRQQRNLAHPESFQPQQFYSNKKIRVSDEAIAEKALLLERLGYVDRDKNVDLLFKFDGNVERIIESLMK